MFWRVIRQIQEPPIVPIGDCRDYDDKIEESTGPPLVTCVLDPCVFSSGMLSRVWVPEYTYEALEENLLKRNETICTIHANYLKGNKQKQDRLQEYGFWLWNQSLSEIHGDSKSGSSGYQPESSTEDKYIQIQNENHCKEYRKYSML